MTTVISDISEALDFILNQTGTQLRLAMPLGIGKPNSFANAIYQRVKNNKILHLEIFTALSLLKPQAASELERRFLEPLVSRIYGTYPDLEYALDAKRDALPSNVRVHELFLKSGDWLNKSHIQQNYISSSYTHIARDIAARKPNILAQAVAGKIENGRLRISLSCNPEITLDLAAMLRVQRANGDTNILVAVINHELPFMPGTAEVPADFFDVIIDDPAGTHTLFCTPNMEISATDYAIGLHASSLVQDGGTLQIGIGSLGDAIAHSLIIRHEKNINYKDLLSELNQGRIQKNINTDIFSEGLYGCSEMFVNGLLQLINKNIIKREVLNQLNLNHSILHGGFFIGPSSFYQTLRDMPNEILKKIDMTSIAYINHLYGDAFADESAKRAQRTKASFINTCMMVTLSGAAVSDTLDDGRVISGVGGQYNFVAMAHELPDARSILMLRSWRIHNGEPKSNIVANYAQCTIPRYLRDIVITEYGVAHLKGKSDSEVIAELLNITDSRFQQDLCAWAKLHKKLDLDYEIPAQFLENTPEKIRTIIGNFRPILPKYPFGHDFTDDELVIIEALQKLKAASDNPIEILKTIVNAIFTEKDVPLRYLKRMGLDETKSLKEKLLQKIFSGNI